MLWQEIQFCFSVLSNPEGGNYVFLKLPACTWLREKLDAKQQ